MKAGIVDGWTYAVGDDVGMTVQASLGVSVGRLVAGQVPDDKSLVTGGREEHVGATIAVSTTVVHIQPYASS